MTQRLVTSNVSVVVPTYKEAKNLPLLVDRINRVRLRNQLDIELLIMDDDSDDGTEQIVAAMNHQWVRLVIRRQKRGLSFAVLDGFKLASHEYLVVMDADLSHPPETIPAMLHHLDGGAEMVFGSRYVDDGSTDVRWGAYRKLNSQVATLLARPFTSMKDPMSGFFAISQATLSRAALLKPVGYKIGFELLVKCRCKNVKEIPIHFVDRIHGESKLTAREQLRYLHHVVRLGSFKLADMFSNKSDVQK